MTRLGGTPTFWLRLSVLVALLTIALKTTAWWVADSVALLSDALESFVNLAGALFAWRMLVVANQPADADHPYGHHKAEYFSAGFEGILIVGAALGIMWSAVMRWVHPEPLQHVGLGVALAVVSSALNGGLAWRMLVAARQYRSMALQADARHLITDVWTSAGVVLGLGLVLVTGWQWLDSLAALLVAGNILREGVRMVWRASQGLMDQAMDEAQLARVHQVLDAFTADGLGPKVIRFDHIQSRDAGARCFVDMHMHMPGDWSLTRAAALRADVEQALMHAVPGLRVSIQLLPSHVEAHLDDQA
ncbi:MAG: cation diffusion facilitator family transporter [Proteobacteria bacterium]|nr:cation diffusion facilitator family transporter [Pseudomonadota bacterium]MDA1327514.1 cation diffusion facilitator family transporter [Pseudomonadota bacterium]